MDREEAIRAFEKIKRNAETHLGKKYAIGCENYYKNKIELAKIALDALRSNEDQTRSNEGALQDHTGDAADMMTPAHIDREAWEPCELCEKFDEIICQFSKRTEYDQSITSKYVEARFCPKCGRPLTPEAWAELEKRVRG